jgi:hypothetical protein
VSHLNVETEVKPAKLVDKIFLNLIEILFKSLEHSFKIFFCVTLLSTDSEFTATVRDPPLNLRKETELGHSQEEGDVKRVTGENILRKIRFSKIGAKVFPIIYFPHFHSRYNEICTLLDTRIYCFTICFLSRNFNRSVDNL